MARSIDSSTPTGFQSLVESIRTVDAQLKVHAARAVNASLTMRNWLIGFHIHEYEQNGNDRAHYGKRLIESLAAELKQKGVSRSEARELRRYRLFYQRYPQIWETVTPDFRNLTHEKGLELSVQIRETLSPNSGPELVTRLSFSHISELLKCDDDRKRAFYETECIRGGWSVRELKRQMGSLLYERSKLSVDQQKLSELTDATAERVDPDQIVRDPYVFEFLGLTPREVMSESDLEQLPSPEVLKQQIETERRRLEEEQGSDT